MIRIKNTDIFYKQNNAHRFNEQKPGTLRAIFSYARVMPSRTKPTGHGNARPDQLSALPHPAPPLPLPLPPDDANLLNYRTSKATFTVFRLG